MGTTLTLHYNWLKPNEFEEIDIWGGELNQNFDGIDTTVWNVSNAAAAADAKAVAAQSTANAALARAGGTMTGPIVLAADGSAALNPVSYQQMNSALLTKQQHDTTLDAIAALSTAADQMILATGLDTFSMVAATASGRALLGAASSYEQRVALDVDQSGIIPHNVSTAATHNIVPGDVGHMVSNNASTMTVIFQDNLATPIQDGARIDFFVWAGAITFTTAAANSQIYAAGNVYTMTKSWAGATAYHLGGGVWIIMGNLG